MFPKKSGKNEKGKKLVLIGELQKKPFSSSAGAPAPLEKRNN